MKVHLRSGVLLVLWLALAIHLPVQASNEAPLTPAVVMPAAVPVPPGFPFGDVNYYLIHSPTSPYDATFINNTQIDNNADSASGAGGVCTLRDALSVVNAGTTVTHPPAHTTFTTVTNAAGTGCSLTLNQNGFSPATPRYVINMPDFTGTPFVYTLTQGELLVSANEVMIASRNGAGNTFIQANANQGVATNRIMRITNAIVHFSQIALRYGRCVGACAVRGSDGGGLLLHNNAKVSLRSSTLGGNEVSGNGGGMWLDSTSEAEFLNSFIRGEGTPGFTDPPTLVLTYTSATNGGGFYNDGGIVTLGSNLGGTYVRFLRVTNNGAGFYNNGGTVNMPRYINSNGASISYAFANNHGGGFYNTATGTVTGSFSVSGRADHDENGSGNGGGFYNEGTVTNDRGGISGIEFPPHHTPPPALTANSAVNGGGFFNTSTGNVTLSGTYVSQTVLQGGDGVGFYNDGGHVIINDGSNVFNNSSRNATSDGGGFYNTNNGQVEIYDSRLSSSVAGNGGNFYNTNGGDVILDHVEGFVNGIGLNGAGFYNTGAGSTVTVRNDSFLLANATGSREAVYGGGFYNTDNGVVTVDRTLIAYNRVWGRGGGFMNNGGTVTVTNSRILENIATTGAGPVLPDGGAVQHDAGTTTVNNSCISGNSVTAVQNTTGTVQNFENNWWGHTTGPSEAGPGSGDSVSTNIDFAPFLTTQISGCGSVSVAKEFLNPIITIGDQSEAIITLVNSSNTTAVNNINFNDVLPAGIIPVSINTTWAQLCTTGTVTLDTVGPTYGFSYSGGSLAANATCQIRVYVQGVQLGDLVNQPFTVNSGATAIAISRAATLHVYPGTFILNKSFNPTAILYGATSVLSFDLNNPLWIGLTGINFTDILPDGIRATAVVSSNCGGTVDLSDPTRIVLTGGAIGATAAPGSGCQLQVRVQGVRVGGYTNEVFTANTTNGFASATLSAPQVINVNASPLFVDKNFTPGTIPFGGTSSLTVRIENRAGLAVSGLQFTDLLPSNIQATSATASQCGGTVDISTPTQVVFTGGTLAASNGFSNGGTDECTITITVTGIVAGTQTNDAFRVDAIETVGAQTYTNATGLSDTATITVVTGVLSGSKLFVDNTLFLGETTNLQIRLFNQSLGNLNGVVRFTDPLPAGIRAVSATASQCGGTVNVSDPTQIIFTNGTLAANDGTLGSGADECTITVLVRAESAGVQVNNNFVVDTNPAGATGTVTGNTATNTVGTLTVSKLFAGGTLTYGDLILITLTLTNPTGANLTGQVNFTDPLPSGFRAESVDSNSCGGTTDVSNPAQIVLSVGTLTANDNAAGGTDTCTLTISVRAVGVGTHTNPSFPVTTTNNWANGNSSPASKIISAGTITGTKSFAGGDTDLVIGEDTTITIHLENPNNAALTGIINLTDALPLELRAVAPLVSNSCGGTVDLSNPAQIALSGGTLTANDFASGGTDECDLVITVRANAVNAATSNPAFNVTTTGGLASGTVAAVPFTVSRGVINVTKTLPATLTIGETATLSILLVNPNNVDLNGIAFTDFVPAGLDIEGTPTSDCGGTLSVTGNNLQVSGGTLQEVGNPANDDECIIAATVRAVDLGAQINPVFSVTTTPDLAGGFSNQTTTTVSTGTLTVTKAFSSATLTIGDPVTVTITLVNPLGVALAGIDLTDNFPAGISAETLTSSTCGGTPNLLTTPANGVQLTGGTLAARNAGTTDECQIIVAARATALGSQTNAAFNVTTTNGFASGTSNADTTTVNAGVIGVTKTFTDDTLNVGETTTLSITLVNPTLIPLSGVQLTDNLPFELNAISATASQCGGTVDISNPAVITLTGGALTASDGVAGSGTDQCTLTVTVRGIAIGNDPNPAFNVTVTGGVAAGSSAAVPMDVDGVLLGVTKAFAHPIRVIGETTTITITLVNPAPLALADLSFTDILPGGLTAISAIASQCGGTVNISDPTRIVFIGGDLAADGDAGNADECVISVDVQAIGLNAQTNPIFTVTDGSSVAFGQSNTPTVTVAPGTLTVTKDFTDTALIIGDTTTVTITIENPNGIALTGISFSDVLPGGVRATTTSPLNQCGGTLDLSAPGTIAFSGGTLAAFDGAATTNDQCTIMVEVASFSLGNQVNNPFTVTTTGGLAAGTSNSDSLMLNPGVFTVTKAFASSTPTIGDTFNLTITIANGAYLGPTGITFIDTLPAGLTVISAADPQCGGGTVDVSNPAVINFSNGTLLGNDEAPGGGDECTITVLVQAVQLGTQTNPVFAVSSFGGYAAGDSNAVSVNVLGGSIGVTKGYSTAAPVIGSPFDLNIDLVNHTGIALIGIAFNDTLPAGLQVISGTAAQCGGTVDLTTTPGTIAFSGGTLGANDSAPGGADECRITIQVKALNLTAQTNPVFAVTTTNNFASGNSSAASVTAIPGVISVTKGFSNVTPTIGELFNLTLDLVNPNGMGLTGIAFVDDLPTGLEVVSGSAAQCGGTVDYTTSPGFLNFSGGSLTLNDAAPGGTDQCQIVIQVRAIGLNTQTNPVFTVISDGGFASGSSNASSVTVGAGTLTVTKGFSAATPTIGETFDLTLDLVNPTGIALNGIALIDTLPAGLVATGGSTTQCGGTVDYTTTPGTLVLSGGTLSANDSAPGGTDQCQLVVQVKAIQLGAQTNLVFNVTTTNGFASGSSNSATTTVGAGTLSVTKGFSTLAPTIGETFDLTIDLVNPTGIDLNGIALSDPVPAGLQVVSGSASQCDGTLDLSTTPGTIAFSGGTLAANDSAPGGADQCQLVVQVKAIQLGAQTNPVFNVTTTNGFASGSSNAATTTVGSGAITGSKSFSDSTPTIGDTLTLTISLANSTGIDLNGVITFSDPVPAGLQITGGSTTQCGGTVDYTTTPGTIAFSGGTMAANDNAVGGADECQISIDVQATQLGSQTNPTFNLTTTNSFAIGTVNAVTANVNAGTLSAIKTFDPASHVIGETSPLRITLENTTGIAISGITFSDLLPAGLVIDSAAASQCGGTVTLQPAAPPSNQIDFAGGTLAARDGTPGGADTCEITAQVRSMDVGAQTNPTFAVTTGGSIADGAADPATLQVNGGILSVDVTYADTRIVTFTETDLIITLSNPTLVGLTGIDFTDVLPAGLEVVSAAAAQCGGTVDISDPTQIIFTGGSLTATDGVVGGTDECQIVVRVVGNTPGVKTHSAFAVTTSNNFASGTATAQALLVDPGVLTVTKAFDPLLVERGANSLITFTLANPNGISMTGMSFIDPLPGGLRAIEAVANQCGGTVDISDPTRIVFTGGGLQATDNAPGGSDECQITVLVQTIEAGDQINPSFEVLTASGLVGGVSAAAKLMVADNPTAVAAAGTGTFADAEFIIKTVDKPLVAIGDVVLYTITFRNPKANTLNNVVISDVFDSRLSNLQVISSDTGSAILVGNTITLQGFSLAPGQSARLVIRATVSNAAQPGDVIANLASLESPDASIHLSNTVYITVLPRLLPATGESMWWRAALLMGLVFLGLGVIVSLRQLYHLRRER